MGLPSLIYEPSYVYMNAQFVACCELLPCTEAQAYGLSAVRQLCVCVGAIQARAPLRPALRARMQEENGETPMGDLTRRSTLAVSAASSARVRVSVCECAWIFRSFVAAHLSLPILSHL